jgi:hypothetical protein
MVEKLNVPRSNCDQDYWHVFEHEAQGQRWRTTW